MAPEPPIRRAPSPSLAHRRRRRLGLIAAASLLLVGAALLGAAAPPEAAEATVTPAHGYRATVLGWSSWYGSYDMGPTGSAWCIDHGLRAPDPSFRYVPTSAPDLDASTGAAIAWIVTAHRGDDALDAAAVMLAVHDLRRASYPFGVLDVDRLQPHDLAGFGGHEAELIARARSIKAEARAHAALRGPFHLTLTFVPSSAPEGRPGGRDAGSDSRGPAGPSAHDPDGRATARLTDAGGRPVVGAGVVIEAQHAVLDGAAAGPTDADGSFTVAYRLAAATPGQRSAFTAHAVAPDPVPATFVSSTVRAQRVVRGSWLGLDTPATLPPTPPTTTTSTSSTTTTSTTSTTRPTSTTSTTSTTGPPRPTVPPTSSTTSTTSTTSTRKASTTTSVPAPSTTLGTDDTPPSSTPPTTTGGQLPRTGARSAGWALIGAGLVLLGATLVALSRGWAR